MAGCQLSEISAWVDPVSVGEHHIADSIHDAGETETHNLRLAI
jgi:hypothetical protein